MKALTIIVSLIIMGCAEFQPYHDEYKLQRLIVVYTDDPGKYCNGHRGCYYPETNTVYVRRHDPEVLGHEICHVIFGDSAHEGECGIVKEVWDHTK